MLCRSDRRQRCEIASSPYALYACLAHRGPGRQYVHSNCSTTSSMREGRRRDQPQVDAAVQPASRVDQARAKARRTRSTREARDGAKRQPNPSMIRRNFSSTLTLYTIGTICQRTESPNPYQISSCWLWESVKKANRSVYVDTVIANQRFLQHHVTKGEMSCVTSESLSFSASPVALIFL